MPPIVHSNNVTRVLDDGRFEHKIRQSWLGTTVDCLEKARLGATGVITWRDSDSSITGSAVHGAIEDTINLQLHADVTLDTPDVVDLFDTHFDRLLEQYQDSSQDWVDRDDEHQIVWIKRRKPDTARKFGRHCATLWADHTWPTLDPLATEVAFGPFVLYEDELRRVVVTGTMDYLDQKLGVVDWKTASQAYTEWEKKRWSIQATVYTWALRQILERTGGSVCGRIYGGPADMFHYVVFPEGHPKPQVVPVERPAAEWDAWFESQVRSLVPLMEAGADVWPRQDNHVLCSPKWCEAWSICKGRDITSPRWATHP